MGVQKQAIILKQTPDYIPEPEYTVVSLEGRTEPYVGSTVSFRQLNELIRLGRSHSRPCKVLIK